ncbi:hypothetical protein BCR32DRAFT_274334 [Anaeromyces robustus]|uniref:Uncharacterized protein n=1 Tax=Anaeromyces robustus TaxID=1754192 RepID=A0A1Y1XQD8_9FUNG|nr:hypothetical protein BCR32DRAFT_274334 [Anaeromyces robustus]|eukprot:ORX87544.1 hypothetical protein BCR32DRAFT_274334 [Anaeromyces robustus]
MKFIPTRIRMGEPLAGIDNSNNNSNNSKIFSLNIINNTTSVINSSSNIINNTFSDFLLLVLTAPQSKINPTVPNLTKSINPDNIRQDSRSNSSNNNNFHT